MTQIDLYMVVDSSILFKEPQFQRQVNFKDNFMTFSSVDLISKERKSKVN